MADEQKQQDENLQDKPLTAPGSQKSVPKQPDENTAANQEQDQIFRDLLSESRIAPLQISEPEFDSFDIQSVIQEAKAVSKPGSRSLNPFGKRSRKNKTKPAAEERFFTPKAAQTGNNETQEISAVSSIAQSAAASDKEETPAAPVQVLRAESSAMPSAAPQKPRTFAEILNSSRYRQNQQAIDSLDQQLEEDQKAESPNQPADIAAVLTETQMAEELQSRDDLAANAAQGETGNAQPAALNDVSSEAKAQDDTPQADQPASVEGLKAPDGEDEQYNYEEYEDKKRFSTTDYKKIEEYLASESARGFHFIRSDGSNYYFAKGAPALYYYRVLYFAKEPDEAYWQNLEKQGWKRMDTIPSRHKRDAGWTIVRNEKKSPADLPREIANEEEKYRYFTKLSSSCRSTMFLLFFVMVCSAVAIFLQYYFKGYIAVIIASGVLFFIALWMFLVYARMLSKARKQASLLSARIRLAENDPNYQALRHAGESDRQLDQDWTALEEKSASDLPDQDADNDPIQQRPEQANQAQTAVSMEESNEVGASLPADQEDVPASQKTAMTSDSEEAKDEEDEKPVSRKARRKEEKKQKKAARKARKQARQS